MRSRKSSSIFIKLSIAAITIICYFYLIRPARIAFTKEIAYPTVDKIIDKYPQIKPYISGGNLYINYLVAEKNKTLAYRPEFGFFFLVAAVSLVFLTSNFLPFKLLGSLHALATVLIFGFLLLGSAGYLWSFILVDVIGSYLTPALSLALVPLVMNGEILSSESNA